MYMYAQTTFSSVQWWLVVVVAAGNLEPPREAQERRESLVQLRPFPLKLPIQLSLASPPTNFSFCSLKKNTRLLHITTDEVYVNPGLPPLPSLFGRALQNNTPAKNRGSICKKIRPWHDNGGTCRGLGSSISVVEVILQHKRPSQSQDGNIACSALQKISYYYYRYNRKNATNPDNLGLSKSFKRTHFAWLQTVVSCNTYLNIFPFK